MTTTPVRFAYRYVPKDQVNMFTGGGLFVALMGTWAAFEYHAWQPAAIGAVAGIAIAALSRFVGAVNFIVNDDGLLVVTRRFRGLGGTWQFYERAAIRRVRYRREVHNADDSENRKTLYLLEVITTDSEIIVVHLSKDIAMPGWLGRRLASELGVDYEEYLD